ncbi:MAG: hypothetical protein WAV52_00050 [Luteococcus japonicus]|nr:hypothetical protein [Luteococcus japonicus]
MLQHVGLHIAEGRLRPVPDALGEGGQDAVLEVRTRMGRHHGGALLGRDRVVADAHHVQLHAAAHQLDLRRHVHRDLGRGVQRDGRPHPLGLLGRDSLLLQEVARDVGAVDLEALVVSAVALGEAQVMEHGAHVEQFRIPLQPTFLASQ